MLRVAGADVTRECVRVVRVGTEQALAHVAPLSRTHKDDANADGGWRDAALQLIVADIRDTFSVLVNQEEQSSVVEAVARTVVDPAKVITRSQPKMGSEDFSDMMQAVPGAYFWVGHDGSVPVHNPGYVLDDKILPIGASMFARIIETRLPAGAHA